MLYLKTLELGDAFMLEMKNVIQLRSTGIPVISLVYHYQKVDGSQIQSSLHTTYSFKSLHNFFREADVSSIASSGIRCCGSKQGRHAQRSSAPGYADRLLVAS